MGIAGQWLWAGRLGAESRSWLPGSSAWSLGRYLASLQPCFHGGQRMTHLQLLEGLACVRSGDSAWSAAMPIQGCKWQTPLPSESHPLFFHLLCISSSNSSSRFPGHCCESGPVPPQVDVFLLYRCPGGSANPAPPGRVLEPTLEPVPDGSVARTSSMLTPLASAMLPTLQPMKPALHTSQGCWSQPSRITVCAVSVPQSPLSPLPPLLTLGWEL